MTYKLISLLIWMTTSFIMLGVGAVYNGEVALVIGSFLLVALVGYVVGEWYTPVRRS